MNCVFFRMKCGFGYGVSHGSALVKYVYIPRLLINKLTTHITADILAATLLTTLPASVGITGMA